MRQPQHFGQPAQGSRLLGDVEAQGLRLASPYSPGGNDGVFGFDSAGLRFGKSYGKGDTLQTGGKGKMYYI